MTKKLVGTRVPLISRADLTFAFDLSLFCGVRGRTNTLQDQKKYGENDDYRLMISKLKCSKLF